MYWHLDSGFHRRSGERRKPAAPRSPRPRIRQVQRMDGGRGVRPGWSVRQNRHGTPRGQTGALLSDDEYAQRRGKLLKEKAALEELINNTDHRLEQQFKLSEETFEITCNAQKRFTEGDLGIKKEILAAVQSNLTLKEIKLLFVARKPFLILENTLYPEKLIIPPIEPKKNEAAQGQKTHLIFMRPYLLRDLESNQDSRLQRPLSYR